MRYAVPTWNRPESRGTAAAMREVWDVEVDPISKLILIGYADSPRTVEEIAAWTGLTESAALGITSRLVGLGLVGEYVE